MSTIELTSTGSDTFESLLDYFTEQTVMFPQGGTDETTFPIVSSTTDVTNEIQQGGRRRRFLPSVKNEQEEEQNEVLLPSSSSTDANELIETLPGGRFKYGPVIVTPRKKRSKTLLTGRRSKNEVLTGPDEERRRARRERNRIAATKCRDKREKALDDLQNQLAEEENLHLKLQKQINELKRRHDDLLNLQSFHQQCFTTSAETSQMSNENEIQLINSSYQEDFLPDDLRFMLERNEPIAVVQMNSSSFERLLTDDLPTGNADFSMYLMNSTVSTSNRLN